MFRRHRADPERVEERIKRLLDLSRGPVSPESWRETVWRRGLRDASRFTHGRPFLFLILASPVVGVFGVVGALVPSFDSWPASVIFGALAALAGALVVAGLTIGICTLRAPYRQRDEARAHLLEAGDLKRLLMLREFLRESMKANRRIMDELVNQGRSGPVSEFDDPWIRDHNRQTRAQLENLGYPELVLKLVLDDDELELDTWEGVLATAKRIDLRAQNFLGGEAFQVLEYGLPGYL